MKHTKDVLRLWMASVVSGGSWEAGCFWPTLPNRPHPAGPEVTAVAPMATLTPLPPLNANIGGSESVSRRLPFRVSARGRFFPSCAPVDPRTHRGDAEMHFDHFRAMTTEILFAAEGRLTRAARVSGARAVIRDGERRFTRFSPDSELMRLNRSSGKWRECISKTCSDLVAGCPILGCGPNPGPVQSSCAAGPGGERCTPDRSIELLEATPCTLELAFAVRNAPRPSLRRNWYPVGRWTSAFRKGMQRSTWGESQKGWLAAKAGGAAGGVRRWLCC